MFFIAFLIFLFVEPQYLPLPGIELVAPADTCLIPAVCAWYGVLMSKLSQILIFLVRRNDDHVIIIEFNVHMLNHQTKDIQEEQALEENNNC